MPKIRYKDITFKPASLKLIETCNKIIADYRAAGYTLTLRQLYYQLVSRDIIANKQTEYKRVGAVINDARLAGLIDWDALEDRTRNLRDLPHWATPNEIIEAVAQQYRLDKWKDCPVRPEVWIEKDALVGVIERVCNDNDIGYFSCRGYTSQSEMWGAAQRFLTRAKLGQGTHVIHLGDHDPSGQDMSRDIEDRIRMFMGSYARQFEFSRIALNRDQIDLYNPPPNPAKSTDSRFQGYAEEHGDESWELDALEPRIISGLIREKVLEIRDTDAYDAVHAREVHDRETLTKVSDNWEQVADYVSSQE